MKFGMILSLLLLFASGCAFFSDESLVTDLDRVAVDSPSRTFDELTHSWSLFDLHGLEHFEDQSGLGIAPQVEFGRGAGSFLRYVISDEGDSIETRLDKLVPHSARLAIEYQRDQEGMAGRLSAGIRGSDYFVTLALWRVDDRGILYDAWVRTDPFVLIRTGEISPGHFIQHVEWKPLVNGKGIGEWRVQ